MGGKGRQPIVISDGIPCSGCFSVSEGYALSRGRGKTSLSNITGAAFLNKEGSYECETEFKTV